jgi:hypothetical protein
MIAASYYYFKTWPLLLTMVAALAGQRFQDVKMKQKGNMIAG